MYSQSNSITLRQKAVAMIRLTRWREHVPYTIPIVLAGSLMAAHNYGYTLNWRTLAVLIANILAMSFAFMINDLEDAPDDARNPKKRAHNVISSGLLSYPEGMSITIGTFALSLGLFALGGLKTFATGGLTLVLCYLYSAKPFRLKSRPVVDVISHILMLAGLLMLSGYLIYDAYPRLAWLMIAAVTLGSAYGQFYNQLEDFETDTLAGLQNTASFLGKTQTQVLMFSSIIGALGCFIAALWTGLFPSWLAPIAIVCSFTMLLFNWQMDMRGNEADAGASFQQPVLICANIVVLIWAAGHLGLLASLV